MQNARGFECLRFLFPLVKYRWDHGDPKFVFQFSMVLHQAVVGGAVASWLVRSSPERVVRVRALSGDVVLCSWARHLPLAVPLSTQVYKWVPVNCWGNLTNCWGMTCDGLASCPGGVEILLAASCYRNQGWAPAAMGFIFLHQAVLNYQNINFSWLHSLTFPRP